MFEGSLKNAFPDSSNVEKLTLLTKKRSEERFLKRSGYLSAFLSKIYLNRYRVQH